MFTIEPSEARFHEALPARHLLQFSPCCFLSPPSALALSLEWPTEGSYVHQIAHLLFGAAMLFFIREIYKTGLQKFRGFRFLIWAWGFCWPCGTSTPLSAIGPIGP